MDVLIDAARDSLEHLVTTQPEIAANWCDQMVRSDAPILRRLALHALPLRGDLTASDKVDWVLDKVGGLQDLPAHHELFRAMRVIYPDATPDQRNSIIAEVFKLTLPDQEGEDTESITAYEHFTWFSWLRDSDPNCDLVKQCVEDILDRYPRFKPRKWADLTHYTKTGFVSPWSAVLLLSKPAYEWAEELLSFQDTDKFEEEAEDGMGFVRNDRVGLANAVEEAATQDFEWGIELADVLAQSESWGSDLWGSLMKSWVNQKGENEQRQMLDRLLQTELHRTHGRAVAETVRALVNERGMSYAFGVLSKANQVAATLWDNLDENEPVSRMEDWYGRAINHSAGILAEFWMHSISSWYNELDPRPAGISEEYSELLDKIVEKQTTGGRLGRSAITRELSFIMAVDEEWANDHMIPLFVSENGDDRQAVWDGFLYGRLSPAAADALQSAFLCAVSDIDELFEQRKQPRELFIKAYTAMVAYFVDEPLDSWIPRFFAKAGVEDRHQFAWNFGNILDDMENESLQGLWRRWLNTFWENRLQGTPTSRDPTEAGAMLDWLPDLRGLYPEAVDLAIKMQSPQLDHSLIVSQLNEKTMWERYPQATAKLLIYLSDCNCAPWVWYEGRDLIQKLITQELPDGLDTELVAILAKLGL